MPVAATTALQALRDKGGISAGQRRPRSTAPGAASGRSRSRSRRRWAPRSPPSRARATVDGRRDRRRQVIDYTREDFTRARRAVRPDLRQWREPPLSTSGGRMAPGGILVVVGRGTGRTGRAAQSGPSRRPSCRASGDQTEAPFLAHRKRDGPRVLRGCSEAGSATPVIDRAIRSPRRPTPSATSSGAGARQGRDHGLSPRWPSSAIVPRDHWLRRPKAGSGPRPRELHMRHLASVLAIGAIALVATACSATGGGSSASGSVGGTGGTLEGTNWILTSFDVGRDLDRGPAGVASTPTSPRTRSAGPAAATSYNGPAIVSGATIKIGPLASTQMACVGAGSRPRAGLPGGSRRCHGFTATSDSLTLFDTAGKPLLVYARGAGQPARGRLERHRLQQRQGGRGVAGRRARRSRRRSPPTRSSARAAATTTTAPTR